MRRSVLVAIGFLSLVAATPASALTTTFGSTLTSPANLNLGCETKPRLSFQTIGAFEFAPSGQPSCTWRQLGIFGDLADTRASTVPGDGTVTGVSIKSGPNPAPIRITVVRLLAPNEDGGINTNKAACCYFVR